ncbi:MAG: hypothetical protein LJE96_01870 [Deltaproteobacteria bacterium]|nr:hypothetical protein [Deltaproteobacteria bacterium]
MPRIEAKKYNITVTKIQVIGTSQINFFRHPAQVLSNKKYSTSSVTPKRVAAFSLHSSASTPKKTKRKKQVNTLKPNMPFLLLANSGNSAWELDFGARLTCRLRAQM